uniref:hypothetical protein n=1 Tax=Candidatus Electronema sp. TaxID=2698783 RepID=UPI00405681DF
MNTGYYFSRAKSAKNRGIWVVFDHDNWPFNSLTLRGIRDRLFFERPTQPCDVEFVARSHRFQSFRYPDLYTLIIDERRAGWQQSDVDALIRAYEQKFGAASLVPLSPVQLEFF